MEFKPDWSTVKQRYEAFWHREVVDRALFYVVAPKPNPETVPAPRSAEARFTDADYLFAAATADMRNTFWGADALPVMSSGTGVFFPDCLFGARPRYGETIWMERAFESLAAPAAGFDPEFGHPLLARQEDYLRRVCEFARNKCLVMAPPNYGGLDSLAAVIGSEQVCLEIAESTFRLRRALARIDAAWLILYERFRNICVEGGVDMTACLPLWSPGRYAVLQCDFMVMISRRHFAEYGLPTVSRSASFLDHALFHLDGAEALHHLDALLDVPDLDGIQWQQGGSWEGPADVEPWLPMLKRIQQAGKCVYVNCLSREVGKVMTELSSHGLFLATAAADEAEARYLEKQVARLTHE